MVRYNNVFSTWSVRHGDPWVYYPEICTEVLACLTGIKVTIIISVAKYLVT